MKKYILILLISAFHNFVFSQDTGLYRVELSNKAKNNIGGDNDYKSIDYGLIDINGSLITKLDTSFYWDILNISNEGTVAIHKYSKTNLQKGFIFIINSQGDTLNKFYNVSHKRYSIGYNPKEFLLNIIKPSGRNEIQAIVGNDGKIMIPFADENIDLEYAGDGYFVRNKERNRIEVLNSEGQLVQDFRYLNFLTKDQADNRLKPLVKIQEGLVPFMYNVNENGWKDVPNNKWGYMNMMKKIVIYPQFEEALPFSEGLAFVKNKDGKWIFISESGKKAFDKDFLIARNYHYEFRHGLMPVTDKNTKKIGYINHKGVYTIAPKFKIASPFSENLAQVSIDGVNFTIIDTAGKTILGNLWRRSDFNTLTWNKHAISDAYLGRYYNHQGKLIWQNPENTILLHNTKLINSLKNSPYVDRVTSFYCVTEDENSPILQFKNIAIFKNINWVNTYNVNFENSPTNLANLYKLTNLKLLDLDKKVTALPNGISKLKMLEYLKLDNTLIERLPDDLYLLRNLKEISLAKNKLKSLPPNFFKLSKEVKIYIQNSELAKNKKIVEQLLNHFKYVQYQSYDFGMPQEVMIDEN